MRTEPRDLRQAAVSLPLAPANPNAPTRAVTRRHQVARFELKPARAIKNTRHVRSSSASGAILATSLAVVAFSATGASARSSADHQYTISRHRSGFAAVCQSVCVCHGANGDGVNGIDLRRGIFRRSVSDDVSNVISTGIASVGMPGFQSFSLPN